MGVRPRIIWFVLAILAPFALVALLWWLGVVPKLSAMGDILSFVSAIVFLFASWRSIETRTALAELQTTLQEKLPAPAGKALESDLLKEGKAMIDAELQKELVDHVWWEWRAYLLGSALLFTVLLLSLARHL